MVQNFQGLNSGVTLEFQPNLYLVKYFGTVFYFDTLNYNCQFFFFSFQINIPKVERNMSSL